MTRSTGWTVLWRCVQVLLLLFAAPFVAVLAACQAQLLPTFLSPQYATFWQDVIAYHSRADGHKSLGQLYDEYDARLIHDYVVNYNFSPALIPSDKAVLAYGLNISVDDQKGNRLDMGGLAGQAIAFLLLYALVAFFVTSLGRAFAWSICHTDRAVRLYRDYFDVPWHRRLLGGVITLPFVGLLALASASLAWTPALGNIGFTHLHLALLFVMLSYVSGLGLRLVRSLISAVFIALGIDPEKTFWDEALTLLITVPVLLFFYGNSWISVSADAVAGLGPLVVTKLLQRFWPALPGLAPVSPDEPASRLSGLWLGVTMAVIGVLMAGLCGCMLVAVPNVGTATVVMVTEAEQPNWEHKGGGTLRFTDGYLFWPKLVAWEGSSTSAGHHVNSYYAPLVSQGVLDEWLEEYRQKGERAEYSFDKVRVVVEFAPEEFARLFPGVGPGQFDPNQPFAAYAPEGHQNVFSMTDSARNALSAGTRGFRGERLVVVEDGARSMGPKESSAAVVVGLACVLPMLIWLTLFLITLPFQPARRPPRPRPLDVVAVGEAEAAEEYYWRDRGRTAGPVPIERLQELARQGRVRRRDPIWITSRRRWVRAREVPDVFPPRGRRDRPE